MQRSLLKGIRECCLRESTPGWKEACELACQAWTLAMDAAGKSAAHDHAANGMADSALEQLQQRFAFSIPSSCIMESNATFGFFSNTVSQLFLLLLGGISTYCTPGTRKVSNFVEEQATRLVSAM